MKVTAVGLAEIMKQLSDLTVHTDFSMHSYTNPIIHMDGDCATGIWLFWIATVRNGGKPNEVFMSEDIAYARTNDGWRISQVDVHFGMPLNVAGETRLTDAKLSTILASKCLVRHLICCGLRVLFV